MTPGQEDVPSTTVAGEDGEASDKALVPRDAATVLVVRDGSEGLEVVMVRRAPSAAFAAGAWVFPGGAVDAADAAHARSLIVGRDAGDAAASVGAASGLGMWFAAVREAFEEAGILVGVDGLPTVPDVAALRRSVNNGERTFASVLEELACVVDAASIAYVDRWVTPLGETRRFDTRFFLALAQPDQDPVHDETETAEAVWARPREVLDRYHAGELFMLPPTVVNLTRLARHGSGQEALEAGLARAGIEPIRPVIHRGDDGSVVLRLGSDEVDDIVIMRGK